MGQININISMDEELQHQFDEFCHDIGMDMATAFSVFAKAAIRQRKIPFEIASDDPFYQPENMAKLRASIKQMEASGGTVHEVDYDQILDR